MINQQILRDRVRLIKAIEGITFKEIAEDVLEMKKGSFYNFMNERTLLSDDKADCLDDFINNCIDN